MHWQGGLVGGGGGGIGGGCSIGGAISNSLNHFEFMF